MVNPDPTPNRLGFALLRYLADRNEALAGDLTEGFHLTRSRLWFWRQLLWAVVTGGFERPFEVRPLRLVESPSWQPPAVDFAVIRRTWQSRGLAASPIDGVGGIGIAALLLLTVSVRPAALTFVGAGIVLGVALGIARVLVTRRRVTAGTPRRSILLNASVRSEY